MRATTQIDKVTLAVEGQIFLTGNILNDSNLVFLAHLIKQTDSFVTGHDRSGHRNILLGQLFHALFDPAQIFIGERPIEFEIVIEPVVHNRTNSHLSGRKQFLDRHGQEMCCGVADNVDAVFITLGDNGKLSVFFNREAGIDQLAIYTAGNGGLGKPGTDVCGNIVNGNRFGKTAVTAIRQGNNRHSRLLGTQR